MSTTTPSRRLESRLAARVTRPLPVPPPSLRTAPSSRWDRFVFWLTAPDALGAAPPANALPPVRDAFREALADLDGHEVRRLFDRLAATRTLRELWHLRAEVYRVVSLQHGQCEAERRVGALDRHFAGRRAVVGVRAPR